MNEYQLSNTRLLHKDRLAVLKRGDWRNTPAPILKCVKCGGRVTTANLQFFLWNACRVQCHDCQKLNKKGGE